MDPRPTATHLPSLDNNPTRKTTRRVHVTRHASRTATTTRRERWTPDPPQRTYQVSTTTRRGRRPDGSTSHGTLPEPRQRPGTRDGPPTPGTQRTSRTATTTRRGRRTAGPTSHGTLPEPRQRTGARDGPPTHRNALTKSRQQPDAGDEPPGPRHTARFPNRDNEPAREMAPDPPQRNALPEPHTGPPRETIRRLAGDAEPASHFPDTKRAAGGSPRQRPRHREPPSRSHPAACHSPPATAPVGTNAG